MLRAEALAKMIKFMEDNPSSGVLSAGTIHDDIPHHNSISTREGATLRCTGEVRHCGFGLFIGTTPSGEFTFDGGGAMNRVRTEDDGYDFSWTTLTPGSRTNLEAARKILPELGYDRPAVLAALRELLADCNE